MKYYLNESIKHILSERFILTEALKLDALKKQSQDICIYAKQLLKDLQGESGKNEEKEATLDKIFDQTTSLRQAIRNVKDVEVIKGKAKEYINLITSLINQVATVKYDNSNTIKSFFDELTTLINNPDATRNELTSEIAKIDTIIQQAKDNLASLATSANEVKSKEKQVEILTKAYKLVYKVSQMTQTEYNDNTDISDAIENLNKVINDQEKFITLCDELTSGDAGDIIENTTVASYNRTGLETDLKGDSNWDAKYKNTPDKKLFWDSYYTGAWGNDATKIKALGPSFQQECAILGFTENSNPFISFIKKYIINKGYFVDTQHYEAIHNAVATNQLLKVDLVTPKSPLNEANNIIFWQDFYNKPGEDASKYLEALYTLRYSVTYETISQLDETKLPDANKQLVINLKKLSDQAEIIHVVMSNATKSTDLVGNNVSPNTNETLRPLTEISQIVKALNVKGGDKPAWNKNNTTTLVADLEDPSSPFHSNIKTWAKKIIYKLANSFPADDTAAANLSSLKSKYPALATTTVSIDESVKIIRELSKFGGMVSWEMLFKIAEEFNKAPREWLK